MDDKRQDETANDRFSDDGCPNDSSTDSTPPGDSASLSFFVTWTPPVNGRGITHRIVL